MKENALIKQKIEVLKSKFIKGELNEKDFDEQFELVQNTGDSFSQTFRKVLLAIAKDIHRNTLKGFL